MVLSERGQAAITDSLFLLAIVSGLSVLMFLFITDYGVVIERTALEFYGTDYATSALQTVLYSSTPRHANETLEEAKEIDYLLAFLKEDYADDREFSDSTKRLLLADINTVMASMLSSHDFIFVMYTIPVHGELTEFVFVLLKYTEFNADTGKVSTEYYFCSPGDGKKYVIEEKLMSQVGGAIKAQPVILRFKTIESEETERVFTTINMWPSLSLPKELIESEDDLNCTMVS